MAEREQINEQVYHIRVKGMLDDRWAGWFEGFAMVAREGGETLLAGPVADQAALHGVLDRIHGLGLPLLLLARADCPCSQKRCPRRRQCGACAAHYRAAGKLPYCLRARGRWDRQCTALAGAG